MKEKKPIGFPIAPLPTIRVGDIEALKNPDGNWLVEALWSSRAVGVLGGPPKCSKTWLACDIALSVASGTKVLGCYSVKEPGPVVFFAAEDPRPLLRERFWGMATHRGLSLKSLEVLFLDVPVLRLDQKEDQEKLSETLRSVRPRLLVLDPLVRLHSLDENSATAISGFLSYLRRLERRYEVAILAFPTGARDHPLTAGIITTEETTDQSSASANAAANGTNAARAFPWR